ncbi:hypothetical protein BJF78_14055 [Pseudonocardia sp. CNS-139]|nr:hypothetical protein BJF78_14055 [Pseudonocardia sp. CNS-139]
MRIGITGHATITPETVLLVAAELRDLLSARGRPLTGVSCLARGADQVFARVVLELGGRLHVVLPAADYAERKVKPDNRAAFDALLAQAADVRVLAFPTSNRDAYAAANDMLLAGVDELVAVWDGVPAGRTGGTAETVGIARARGIPVTVVWPAGAARG